MQSSSTRATDEVEWICEGGDVILRNDLGSLTARFHGEYWTLDMIRTTKGQRRQGWGTALVSMFLDHVESIACETDELQEVYLWVAGPPYEPDALHQQQLINWYVRRGFLMMDYAAKKMCWASKGGSERE